MMEWYGLETKEIKKGDLLNAVMKVVHTDEDLDSLVTKIPLLGFL